MDCLRTAITTAGLILILSTQIASGQSAPSVGNLGLRAPNLQTTIERNAIRPDLAPHVFSPNLPTLAPGHTSPSATMGTNVAASLPSRLLADPVVGATSVGFYNDAGQPLGFQFIVGGVAQRIELAPRQVLTVDAANGDLKAIVGTGNTDFQTVLARGKIYVLRADGAKWVLAAF